MEKQKPTIYLSNWSSHKTKGCHGPGKKFTIMARPRRWEHGDGIVSSLVPHVADLDACRKGHISIDEYRENFLSDKKALNMFAPGNLCANLSDLYCPGELSLFANVVVVRSGDTLCCACSRDAAARGECHRIWAAQLLLGAGWRVILDGKELE